MFSKNFTIRAPLLPIGPCSVLRALCSLPLTSMSAAPPGHVAILHRVCFRCFGPPWDLRVLEMELQMRAFVQVDWLTEKMRTTNFTVSVLHDELVQKERDAIVTEFLGGAS